MKPEAMQRTLRQIALPEVGHAGQEHLATAEIAVAGEDLVAEVAARYLAAAGIGRLRLIGSVDPPDAFQDSLRQSNPDVAIERAPWPADGTTWLAVLSGVQLVLRSGFDDDAMLRAAVRLGIPAVVARGRDTEAELISFRKQGPCPHAALDVPSRRTGSPQNGGAAIAAGTLAAAEAIHTLLGNGGPARARHLAVPLDGGAPRVQEIPWTPECFACGGSGLEMSFS